MSNLHQTPVALVVDCINSLYKMREISSGERAKLLELTTQSSQSGNWDELREQLFKLRASSCVKKMIDYAIDATREKTGGNVL